MGSITKRIASLFGHDSVIKKFNDAEDYVNHVQELIADPRYKLRRTIVIKHFERAYSIDLECGSGASFEQYFQWSSSDDVSHVVESLQTVGLNHFAHYAQQAINIAFPDGQIPEYNACGFYNILEKEFNEKELAKLKELYKKAWNEGDESYIVFAEYLKANKVIAHIKSIRKPVPSGQRDHQLISEHKQLVKQRKKFVASRRAGDKKRIKALRKQNR